jgi:hypothetical protein
MKRIALILMPFATVATAAILVGARMASPRMAPNADAANVPVVVELFTSEGCSSCPAADAALRELEASQPLTGVEVIALGEHVDYWNRLGWKDLFSSPAFTERQRAYAASFGTGNYTPQVVVNGRYEFVGSRQQQLQETIVKVAQEPRATVRLARTAHDQLAVSVADLPAGTKQAEVLLAVTEASLSSQVGRGENKGRLLRHASVVRTLRPLGAISNGTFTASVPLSLSSEWKRPNLRAVVLVQEKASRHVVGVASLSLAGQDLSSRN